MNLDIISKHRGPIYGLAILWIVVFHAGAINSVDYSFGMSALMPLKRFIAAGNVGVDMFLFLSGVCLYFSFTRNGNIVEFLGKRFVRVLPAVWLVDGIYWLVYYGFMKGDWLGFASRMTLTRFWMTGDSSIWFVSLILLLYLLFPLIYLYLFDVKAKYSGFLRLLVLMATTYTLNLLLWQTNADVYSMVEVATTRIPVFILGIWVGQFVYEKRKLPRVFVVLAPLCAIFFLLVFGFKLLDYPALRFFYLVGGVSLSYTVALICTMFDKLPEKKRLLYRFLAWTGGFSLELYITHIALNQILRHQSFYVKGDLTQYALMAVAAFFLACAVMKIVNFGRAALKKRKMGQLA